MVQLIEMLSSVSGDSDDVSAPAMAAEEPAGGSGEAAQDAGLDIMSLTVPELKQELKQRGLKVGGKKNELQERLSEALAGSMGAGEAESSEVFSSFLLCAACTSLELTPHLMLPGRRSIF